MIQIHRHLLQVHNLDRDILTSFRGTFGDIYFSKRPLTNWMFREHIFRRICWPSVLLGTCLFAIFFLFVMFFPRNDASRTLRWNQDDTERTLFNRKIRHCFGKRSLVIYFLFIVLRNRRRLSCVLGHIFWFSLKSEYRDVYLCSATRSSTKSQFLREKECIR